MTKMLKYCRECGKNFIAKPANRKYCDTCRKLKKKGGKPKMRNKFVVIPGNQKIHQVKELIDINEWDVVSITFGDGIKKDWREISLIVEIRE